MLQQLKGDVNLSMKTSGNCTDHNSTFHPQYTKNLEMPNKECYKIKDFHRCYIFTKLSVSAMNALGCALSMNVLNTEYKQ